MKSNEIPSSEELKNEILCRLIDDLVEGNCDNAEKMIIEALRIGINPDDIFRDCILEACNRAINLRNEGVYFVPELYMTAKAIRKCMKVLRPISPEADARGSKYILFLNLDKAPDIVDPVTLGNTFEVWAILACNAFSCIEENFSSIEKAIDYVRNHQVDMILILGYGRAIQNTINALEKENLRQSVKIAIAGSWGKSDQKALEVGVDVILPENSDIANKVLALLRRQ